MTEPAPQARVKPALVILAGGASSRLGQCKALVPLTPDSPLELLTRAGRCFDSVAALVVSGKDHVAIARALPSGLELVHNAVWEQGRTSSVACAARARAGFDLCLAPVDVPLVPAAVFQHLCSTWLAALSPPRGWLAPRLADHPASFGHPVIVGRELLSELSTIEPDEGLRRLREAAQPLFSVEVAWPEILDDLDTPADLARLRTRSRS